MDLTDFKNAIDYNPNSYLLKNEEHKVNKESKEQKETKKENYMELSERELMQNQINDLKKQLMELQNKKEEPKKNTDIYKIILKILLFIFIGIVIILLCEQITNIAINIGMKNAITLFENKNI